jgi:hypothetical protein
MLSRFPPDTPSYLYSRFFLFIPCCMLGCVSIITKAHFRRLDMHIFVEKPRRSTTAPAFIASICKPLQHNCIFQTLETHPSFICRNVYGLVFYHFSVLK